MAIIHKLVEANPAKLVTAGAFHVVTSFLLFNDNVTLGTRFGVLCG